MAKARIGVIGAGWWAVENHIPIVMKDDRAEIVAICNIDENALRATQEKFAIPIAETDYRKMLSSSEFDGVIVASPQTLHAEHAEAALKKKAHVLVEKPFTTTIRDARRLLDTAQQVGRTITVPYGWNYEAIARAALDLMAEHPIGEICHASVHMATATEELFSGKGLRGIEASLVQLKNSTHADPDNFGGFSWIQLSHALGLFFLLVDLDPEEIFAFSGLSQTGTDLHNAVAVRLDNGATLAVSGSAGLAWGQKSQMELRIFGSKGHITLDIEREWVRLDIKDGASQERKFPDGEGNYRCQGPLEHFIATCTGEQSDNLSNGLLGARSTAVLAGMRKSAQFNRPVQIDSVARVTSQAGQ